jgi:hypothetical protein
MSKSIRCPVCDKPIPLCDCDCSKCLHEGCQYKHEMEAEFAVTEAK